MTAPERETAGAVRSAHVAHFLPPDWARVARLAVPALERVARTTSAPQFLVLVPDGSAAISLARAFAALPGAEGRRIVAATSAARAKRLLAAGPAHVVIGAPAALAPIVAASALKLDQVSTVLFASADELDADDADMATILTEIPRGAARLLTALEPTPTVEALLERYMHKARRVTDDVVPNTDDPVATVVRFLTVGGAPVEALPSVLDELDAPSSTVICTDATAAAAARTLLASIGYPDDVLARVTDGDVSSNCALVVLLGVPTAAVWSRMVAAQPAQIVAVIPPREHSALQRLAGTATIQPFAARAAVLKARASDARARAELREALAAGIPSREVLALEPLLGEYDGIEIAAAALRLLERTRSTQAELVQAAEQRVRTTMKENESAREASEGHGARPERLGGFSSRGGERGGERGRGFGSRPDRDSRSGRGGERPERGERPRTFGARSDKPKFGPRGDKPKFGPRGDKPKFGAGADRPRGPRRDDGGRAPRGPR